MDISTGLRTAAQCFQDRCLYAGAKWAAEMLNSLSNNTNSSNGVSNALLPSGNIASTSDDETSQTESDLITLARSYFHTKEFDRAAYHLKSMAVQSALGKFLRIYSKYLAGEKRRDEISPDLMGPVDSKLSPNLEIPGLMKELQALIAADQMDTYLYYLLGVFQSRQKNREDAFESLCTAINLFPFNWNAWVELVSLAEDVDMPKLVRKLPVDNVMFNIFLVLVALDRGTDELQIGASDIRAESALDKLRELFPTSLWLQRSTAVIKYNTEDFTECARIFEAVIRQDPHSLDYLDLYSNVLYVMNQTAKLSFLAHHATEIEKYHPETCVIVGNYYSLRGEHEKAIQYFRRAIKLNRNYVTAWLLIGHEYVELKNGSKAIEAYRRGVDLSPRDHRFWYGLGQTYELLKMPYFALYYFKRAAELREDDARMWNVLGDNYERLAESSEQPTDGELPPNINPQGLRENGNQEAIKCYHRALKSYGDTVAIQTACMRLAKLHKDMGENDLAAWYYQCVLDEITNSEKADLDKVRVQSTAHRVDASLFLAAYYRDKQNWARAEKVIQNISHSEEGMALSREIRSMRSAAESEQQANGTFGQDKRRPTVGGLTIEERGEGSARRIGSGARWRTGDKM
ncbi:anaphase promoting complex subunit 8 [Cladochytrium replicatum]|nr:anaphase promoting complex subunit 8 [Cladochytrium replicatum]